MLGMKNVLHFPRLIFDRQHIPTNYSRSGASDGKPFSIYRLDWDGLDAWKSQQWGLAPDHQRYNCVKKLAQCQHLHATKEEALACGDGDEYAFAIPVDFPGGLPEPWRAVVNRMEFAIKPEYLREINYNTQRAIEEWSRPRGFDANQVFWCRQPAVQHVKVAFEMLADCMWDRDTGWFDRKADRWLAQTMLRYNFWSWQDRKYAKLHSGIDEWTLTVDRATKRNASEMVGGDVLSVRRAFINSILQFEERMQAVTNKPDAISDLAAKELDEIAEMFTKADEDPVGAVVVTRAGTAVQVTTNNSTIHIPAGPAEWIVQLAASPGYNLWPSTQEAFIRAWKARRTFLMAPMRASKSTVSGLCILRALLEAQHGKEQVHIYYAASDVKYAADMLQTTVLSHLCASPSTQKVSPALQPIVDVAMNSPHLPWMTWKFGNAILHAVSIDELKLMSTKQHISLIVINEGYTWDRPDADHIIYEMATEDDSVLVSPGGADADTRVLKFHELKN